MINHLKSINLDLFCIFGGLESATHTVIKVVKVSTHNNKTNDLRHELDMVNTHISLFARFGY